MGELVYLYSVAGWLPSKARRVETTVPPKALPLLLCGCLWAPLFYSLTESKLSLLLMCLVFLWTLPTALICLPCSVLLRFPGLWS